MAAPVELATTDRTVGSTRLARLIREVSHLGGRPSRPPTPSAARPTARWRTVSGA